MLHVLACKTGVIYLFLFVSDFCFCSRDSVDNTLLDLLNSSYPTQPHSLIAISKIQLVVYYQCCVLIG